MHILRRCGHWNYSWKYCLEFFFFFVVANPPQAGYQNWSELSSYQYRSNTTWGVHLHNYPLAESSWRPFARRFTAACALAPFFLVLFPCCFLRFPRSPPSFFRAIFRLLSSSVPSPVRLDSAVTAILSSYTFYRPVSIYSFFLPRYRLCRLKISRAVVTAASRNGLKLIMTDSCEPKMETPRMMATRKSAMLAQCSEKKFCFMFTGSEAFQIANCILHVFDSRKKTEEKKNFI